MLSGICQNLSCNSSQEDARHHRAQHLAGRAANPIQHFTGCPRTPRAENIALNFSSSPAGTRHSFWLSRYMPGQKLLQLAVSGARIIGVRAVANPTHPVSRRGLTEVNENSGAINIYPRVSKGRDRTTARVQSASSLSCGLSGNRQ